MTSNIIGLKNFLHFALDHRAIQLYSQLFLWLLQNCARLSEELAEMA